MTMNVLTFRSLSAALMMTFALAFAPSAQAADFVVEPLDYDIPAAVEEAASEGNNLIVMFHQNGCPYCDKMRKRVFPNPKVDAYFSGKFTLIEINMKGSLEAVSHTGEAKTEKEYADEMRVRATPMIVFYSKDTKVALRLVGYQDPEMFLAAGRYVHNGVFKDGTSFISYVRSGAK